MAELKLVVVAVVCYLVTLLAIISTGPTVPWTTFKAKAKDDDFTSVDSEFRLTLYKRYREDKGADGGDWKNDDITEIDDDDFQNYPAFEFNRGTTCITLFFSALVGTYYILCGISFLKRNVEREFTCALVMLLLTIMCWSGSGYWHNRMVRDFYKDWKRAGLDVSDEVNCSAGCALQFVNSFVCLALAIIMLAVAHFDSFKKKDADDDEKKNTTKPSAPPPEAKTNDDKV